MKYQVPFTAWGLVTIEAGSYEEAKEKTEANREEFLMAALRDVENNLNIQFDPDGIKEGDVGEPVIAD